MDEPELLTHQRQALRAFRTAEAERAKLEKEREEQAQTAIKKSQGEAKARTDAAQRCLKEAQRAVKDVQELLNRNNMGHLFSQEGTMKIPIPDKQPGVANTVEELGHTARVARQASAAIHAVVAVLRAQSALNSLRDLLPHGWDQYTPPSRELVSQADAILATAIQKASSSDSSTISEAGALAMKARDLLAQAATTGAGEREKERSTLNKKEDEIKRKSHAGYGFLVAAGAFFVISLLISGLRYQPQRVGPTRVFISNTGLTLDGDSYQAGTSFQVTRETNVSICINTRSGQKCYTPDGILRYGKLDSGYATVYQDILGGVFVAFFSIVIPIGVWIGGALAIKTSRIGAKRREIQEQEAFIAKLKEFCDSIKQM